MLRRLIAVTMLAATVAADAEQVPADLSVADNGELAARIIVTPDIEGFWKAWEGPTPPHIRTTDTITQSQPAFATIVFTGCRPAANGNCRISAAFSILDPSGAVYGRQGPMAGWSGPPAPGRNMLVIEAYLGFELEPQDKLGPYIIKGELKDEIAGTSVTVQATVVAKAQPSA